MWRFNNVSTIRQDVRYFASELDDGQYVNVLKLNETTFGRYVFISATGRDDDRFYVKKWLYNKFFNFGEIKVFRQMCREQLYIHSW